MSSMPVADRQASWPVRGILVAAAVIAAGYGLAFGGGRIPIAGAWLLAAGNALLVPCAMALGAPLQGRSGRTIRIVLAALGVVLFGTIATALLVRAPESASSPLLLGLPRRTAIVLLGVGGLPMLVLPVLFAWSFDAGPFAPDRIAALRRLGPDDLSDESSSGSGRE